MTLALATLKTELTKAFAAYPTSTADAAKKQAAAYAKYAKGAIFGVAVMGNIDPKTKALEATLATALKAYAPSPSVYAAAWASGLSAFWLGNPVAGPGAVGTTIVPAGVAAVAPALTTLMTAAERETAIFAGKMATILHTATKTVTATVTVAPAAAAVVPVL